MQYEIEDLKKQFDKEAIVAFVVAVKKLNTEMLERGEELIKRLWYLEKTKRFKEHVGYRKAMFKDFIWEVCHIPYNRYRELAWAYNWFPEESKRLGPHVIQTIRGKVGVLGVPKVIGQIDAAIGKLKDHSKEREVVNSVIDRLASKVVKKNPDVDTKAYWRQKFTAEHKLNLAKDNEIHALREQVAKLKETVIRLTKEIDVDEPERVPDRPQMSA